MKNTQYFIYRSLDEIINRILLIEFIDETEFELYRKIFHNKQI